LKIKKIHIQNYKSLVNLEIAEPNPFTVFAGPNGAGKSNIFEAIEYGNLIFKVNRTTDVENLFGGADAFLNNNSQNKILQFGYEFSNFESSFVVDFSSISNGQGLIHKNRYRFNNFKFGNELSYSEVFAKKGIRYNKELEQFQENFSRLFIGNSKIQKLNTSGDKQLNSNGENLEKVLARILKDKRLKEELSEWLMLFIPGFDDIEIYADAISGKDTLLFYELYSQKPFTRSLISDGTYNILCLLTSIYQSDSPQFLCIEEPENGLNPYVIKTLVEFFRNQCKEKGHYIWLNTHSQTLVKYLKPEELILVDKLSGATHVKQFSKEYDLHNLEMDEAWLSNALGGGVPW